ERALHAHTVGDASHGERGRGPRAALPDHHTFESLQALLLSFDDLDRHPDGVARLEAAAVFLELSRLDDMYGLHARGSLLEIVIGRPALTEARHPLLLFGREIRRLQQIPPPLPRPPDRHDAFPPLDPGVITGAQHVGHGPLRERLG